MVVTNDSRKQTLKISVSDTESSEELEESENENGTDNETKSNDDISDNDNNVEIKNEAWADSIAKILGANKPKNKKTLVLSRAKKLADVKKKENNALSTFEVVGDENKDVKPADVELKTEDKTDEPKAKRKKEEKPSIRVKPNILEKDRERVLSKIATKGVVQLFNAVRNQQKTFERELDKDIPEGKKEKVLKKFDKRAFLDTLMGQTKSVVVDDTSKKVKDEVKPENIKTGWNALRDDFMMGAKMKDWDKESVDE